MFQGLNARFGFEVWAQVGVNFILLEWSYATGEFDGSYLKPKIGYSCQSPLNKIAILSLKLAIPADPPSTR